MKLLSNCIGATLLMIICSCSTPAVITSSWHKPDAPTNNYNNIFIAAITAEITDKQMIEDNLQRDLQQKGITVEKSMDLFPPKTAGQKLNVAISKIAPTGAEGILTVALLRKDKETRFDPLPVWSPVGQDYVNAYPEQFTNGRGRNFEYDGFYRDMNVYYVETRFYNIKTKQLIWTAQSKTYAPNNIDGFVKGYLQSIYGKMQKDGVIAMANINK